MIIGWSFLSYTLGRYSPLGYIEGIIGCQSFSHPSFAYDYSFVVTGFSSFGTIRARRWSYGTTSSTTRQAIMT